MTPTEWIDADIQKPKAQERVQIAYYDADDRPRVTIGWYAPRWKIPTSYFADEVDDEYSDELDDYFLKEGWVDESVESEFHYRVRNVSHWQPLATHPDLALGQQTLAPCPHCTSLEVGLAAGLDRSTGAPQKFWHVQCQACGATQLSRYSEPREAIRAWNRSLDTLVNRWGQSLTLT